MYSGRLEESRKMSSGAISRTCCLRVKRLNILLIIHELTPRHTHSLSEEFHAERLKEPHNCYRPERKKRQRVKCRLRVLRDQPKEIHHKSEEERFPRTIQKGEHDNDSERNEPVYVERSQEPRKKQERS